MSRLIDADVFRKRIDRYPPEIRDAVKKELRHTPTIEERKKGKWIKKMRITETKECTSYDPDWYCACCGTKYDPHIARMVNFCYVCGDDMRGE